MLLTTLKFVAFIWVSLLIAGLTFLAMVYLFDLLARTIRQRFARRR
jgi:hypothetical protein